MNKILIKTYREQYLKKHFDMNIGYRYPESAPKDVIGDFEMISLLDVCWKNNVDKE